MEIRIVHEQSEFNKVAFHSETSDLPIDIKWKIVNGNTRINALIPIVKRLAKMSKSTFNNFVNFNH